MIKSSGNFSIKQTGTCEYIAPEIWNKEEIGNKEELKKNIQKRDSKNFFCFLK